ncbi:MAG: low molecular weight protein-tyrosine-phosphatase [Ignavibacteriaceae bacterium]
MKKKVLFVCMGNICRSPAAEGVMKKMIEDNNLENKIEVDSAGTIGFHQGEPADPRMSIHASKRGYNLTSRSRKFIPEKDFEEFDYIVTMDDNNYEDILSLDRNNKYAHKVHKFSKFFVNNDNTEVPDPYYGGSEGFEIVLDLLEDGNKNLLEKIRKDIEARSS